MTNEVHEARARIKVRVDAWKDANEGWATSPAMTVLKGKMSESTFKAYLTTLPIYLQWANKTPDVMVRERIEDMANTDPTKRFRYEESMIGFKAYLVEKHYKAGSIKTMLSRVSGLFANHRINLNMEPSFWKRSNKDESEKVSNGKVTKRYPDNEEVRLIVQQANVIDSLAITISYQTGLMPVDIVGLTWNQINIDFENEVRDFVFVESIRQKTKALHLIVLSPDVLHLLKAEWMAQGKPTEGYVFTGQVAGTALQSQSIARRFKDYAVKALGKMRGSSLVFKDLRQSYNEALLDANLNDEIKDVLMGHRRKGSKASYSVSSASISKVYQNDVFPSIALNGWLLKQQAEGYPELKQAISQLETENHAYKLRVDGLQERIALMEHNFNKAMVEIMAQNDLDFIMVDKLDSPKKQ